MSGGWPPGPEATRRAEVVEAREVGWNRVDAERGPHVRPAVGVPGV